MKRNAKTMPLLRDNVGTVLFLRPKDFAEPTVLRHTYIFLTFP